MVENTGRGVDVGDVIRVAHGVGGSTTEWQRSPPPHAVYMIPLGDRYDGNEWSTVKVWYEHGEIIKMTDGATWYLYQEALPMVDVDNSDVLSFDADAFSYSYDRAGGTHILVHDGKPETVEK